MRLTNQGGGVHIRQGLVKCLPGGPTIRDCVVEKNWGAHHGAINDHGLSTIIERCTIRNNHSEEEGGGLQVHSGSPTITNCTFINNTSDGEGGGAWVGTDNDPTCTGPSTANFVNCVFDGNSAVLGGGLFIKSQAAPTTTGCTFVRNTVTTNGAGLYCDIDASATAQGCAFLENVALREGGAVYNAGSNPAFTACVFRGNSAGLYAGAMRNLSSDPVLTGCVFAANSSGGYGGAVHDRLSNPTFTRCAFFGNSAVSDGGAIFNINRSSPIFRDSLFAGNAAQRIGGALANRDSSHPAIYHCTLHANSAGQAVGGIDNDSQSGASLTNSIVWSSSGGAFGGTGAPTATYSDIEGGYAGEGNISATPLFVDADGSDNTVGTEDDDLRLRRGSPGINVGDPAFAAVANETDLGGGPRLVGCRVDMGAYESGALQIPGDFNADQVVNLADFAAFDLCAFNPVHRAHWRDACLCVFDFDANEFVDLSDYATFPWDLGLCNELADCDDGDPCNGLEACVAGGCRQGTPVECDDGNTCTDDACEAGICVRAHNTTACDDNDACTANDQCAAGACSGDAIDCDDRNPCTTDGCDPATGCSHHANVEPCDDGNACTSDDRCVGGVCIGGLASNCDDVNSCTDDSCEPSGVCVFTADDTNACDDGDVCNGLATCTGGVCLAGADLTCDDGNPCTDDSCDPSAGCVFAGDDSNSCSDGDACTVGDACVSGSCDSGVLVDCSSVAAPCNMARCKPDGPEGNCDDGTPAPTDTPCNADANLCTVDRCDGLGACVLDANVHCPGPADGCDGGQSCDPASGDCVDDTDPAAGTLCNEDANQCTIDRCDGLGMCVLDTNVHCPGPAGECDGGQSCDPASGDCVDDADSVAGTPCNDDANECTVDRCDGLGACLFESGVSCPGPTNDCDGGQVCDPENGTCLDAIELAAGTPCNADDDPCTPDQCDGAGTCEVGPGCPPPQVCDKALGCQP